MDGSVDRLRKKLGVKSDDSYLLYPPVNYSDLLKVESLPDTDSLPEQADWIQAFYTQKSKLDKDIFSLVSKISKTGQLWISWPKKSSGVETDLSDSVVRSIGLSNGLVDVKVAAVDDVWSGLKFVYRLSER